MNLCAFSLAGHRLAALPSGALWWDSLRLLCVSDLHLGKAGRVARMGGPQLPPYDTLDTLGRLDADIRATRPQTVVCLGDSFDDAAAAEELDEEVRLWLLRLQAGRTWVWIAGNHDPGGAGPGGTHRDELLVEGLTFRHIAMPGATAEVSGHYHPKAVVSGRAGRVSRPCMLHDGSRAILPAYGTYTGGLRWTDPALRRLLGPGARAVVTGLRPVEFPLPAGMADGA